MNKIIVEKLKLGDTVKFRPRGNSMTGKISSGQLVTVEPLPTSSCAPVAILSCVCARGVKSCPVPHVDPEVGDIVYCKVHGSIYLHIIKAVKGSRDALQYQIGNNHGKINGWTKRSNIFGRCIKVEN